MSEEIAGFPKQERCKTNGCDVVVIRSKANGYSRFCDECRQNYGRFKRQEHIDEYEVRMRRAMERKV